MQNQGVRLGCHFTILVLVLFTSSESKMEIRNLHQDPVLLIHHKDCKVQTGLIKILHPINITTIATNIDVLNKIARKIDINLPISQLVIQKSRELHNNLLQIKPTEQKRKRRWDALGSAWKWLAGNPDADDLRILNKTTNELIQENNQQIKINQMITHRIEDISNTVNQIIAQQNLENKILLEEYEAIKLLLYMDTLNSIVVEIQDTILRTRISLPNNKLLTLKEILHIESLLHEQGITTRYPEEALDYATPKIATRKDLLLYILEIPQLEKAQSEIIQIFPLIVEDTIITNVPDFIVRSMDKIFTTTHPDDYIQRTTYMKLLEDSCTHSIVTGTTSHCNAIKENSTFANLISDNGILINNAKTLHLHSGCGPQNRTLTGNFLLKFSNCSITINDQVFTSQEVTGNTRDLQGAFPNLIINRTIIEHHDIKTLTNLTTTNRQQLEFIHVKQYKHQNWIFGMLGGLSLSTVAITGFIMYVCFRKRIVTIMIKQPKNKDQESSRSISDNNHNQDEDVLFSPPGGVTESRSG